MRLLFLVLAGCSGESSDTGDTGIVDGCRAGEPRPDEPRFAIVSHPYAAGAVQSDAWEVLSFASDGTLARGAAFTMGRATGGVVRFAPDGSLAVAVQEDGTLGVVALDEAGTPDVIATDFADNGDGDTFYANDVVFDPGGERLWVVDGNWANNGGGIYAVDLDCTTGEPTAAGLVVESKLGTHLLPVGDRFAYVADEVSDSGPGDHVHLLGPDLTRLGGAALWPDDEAIAGGATLAGDGTYVLVGDNSGFASVPNRVAAARVDGDDLVPVQVMPDIEDPIAIAAWGAATLVASGFGDALIEVAYEPGPTPFSEAGELSTIGSPQLPGAIAVTAAPDGDGWMLVSEVSAVRRVRAMSDGTLTDLGTLSFGSGYDAIVGAVGVQP